MRWPSRRSGVTQRRSSATTTFTYEPTFNQVTSITDPRGNRTTLTYDAKGNPTTLAYDLRGLLTSVTDALGNGQLTRLLNQGPGASPVTLADFASTYDAVGNRATRTTTNGIASYTYDALNYLTQASQPDPIDPLRQVTEAFAYDPVGNRTSSHLATGQVHDAANRLLEDAQFTCTYDANGNLASKTSKATGATTTYTYDAENRLTRVQTPTLTALYRYDPLGRRIAKEVTQAGTSTITRFIYDNEDILLELDGSNQVLARYTHRPGIDEPLIMLRQGQAFFYHADGLGSIWDLTDAAGTAVRSYTYDSFGNLLAQPGTLANPYTYTGREVDPETGLFHYRSRQYDAESGRFFAEDDVQFAFLRAPASLNLYTYVLNNPVRYIDPNGHQPLDVCVSTPIGFDKFLGCFGSCAGDEVRANLSKLGRDLKSSAITGTAFGVGVCAAIVIGEPYLLPAFPACAGLASVSTIGVLATASVANFNIGTAGSLIGCGLGCIP